MGKATVLNNYGNGYYRIKLLYNNAQIDAELLALQQANGQYITILYNAQQTLENISDDVIIARTAMNKTIEQYKNNLISKGNEIPDVIPPIPENDPETGLPWTDPDRAQDALLFDGINLARTNASVASVARNPDLDTAILKHLRQQSSSIKTGHYGEYQSTVADRIALEGYAALTVYESLGYGYSSAENVINYWLNSSEYSAHLLDATVTEIGVAYKYASSHPQTYLWGIILALPDPDPPSIITATYPEDPLKEKANQTEINLDKITLDKIATPSVKITYPEKLTESVKNFAIARAKEIAAEKELARIMAEKLSRDIRIAKLNNLKNTIIEEIAAWCVTYSTSIPIGATVSTLEVPGYYDASVNIAPAGKNLPEYGQLVAAEGMNPSQIFVNAALEAGHLKWKPLCRYGTVLGISSNVGTIELFETVERKIDNGELEMNINETEILYSVPFIYLGCDSRAFEIGDIVVVTWLDQDRTKPRVIGFRDHPRSCDGRYSWVQT